MVTRRIRIPVLCAAVTLAAALTSCTSGDKPDPKTGGAAAVTSGVPDVEPSGALPPGWDMSELGRGYNLATGDFFSTAGLSTSPILNVPKLVADRRVRWQRFTDGQDRAYIGHSVQEYTQSISRGLGLGIGSDGALLGAVGLNFTDSTAITSEQVLLTDNAEIRKLQMFIEGGSEPANLEPYLTASFKADVNNPDLSPRQLFTSYGTHLPYNMGYGGRLSMNYVYENTARKSDSKLSVELAGVYDAISGHIDVGNQTEVADLEQNSTIIIRSTGGTNAIDVTSIPAAAASYAQWAGTLDADNPASLSFIGPAVPDDAIAQWAIPIWDFASDPVRAQAIETEFDNELAPQYVKDIYLGEGTTSAAAENDLLAKIPPTSVHRQFVTKDWDLNRGSGGNYIYLGYTLTTDPTQAVTDIVITDGEDADSYSKNGVSYIPTKVDLNHTVGGDYLWLLYTHDPKAAMQPGYVADDIGIQVGADDTPNIQAGSGWGTIHTDLNKRAGGDSIYLWYQLEQPLTVPVLPTQA